MKRSTSLLTAAGVAVLAGTVWLSQGGPALAQVAKVVLAEIVNTPDNPVPVAAQGTTRVEGTVNLGGTPVVEVASSDRDPVVVRSAGDCAPFHRTLFFQIPDGQFSGAASFTVPVDKRLVIEQVTIKATAPPTGFVQASISNTVEGVTITPDLIMVSQGVFGGDTRILLASQNVRWYADPGTDVDVSATKSFSDHGNVYATISGYLVDCPPRR